MYQLAAIAFIVAAGGGAAYFAQRPTVATSEGLADLLRDTADYRDVAGLTITCDDHVLIGVDGARYHCTVTNQHGEVDERACTIYRSGSMNCLMTSTERTHTVPKSGDTWE